MSECQKHFISSKEQKLTLVSSGHNSHILSCSSSQPTSTSFKITLRQTDRPLWLRPVRKLLHPRHFKSNIYIYLKCRVTGGALHTLLHTDVTAVSSVIVIDKGEGICPSHSENTAFVWNHVLHFSTYGSAVLQFWSGNTASAILALPHYSCIIMGKHSVPCFHPAESQQKQQAFWVFFTYCFINTENSDILLLWHSVLLLLYNRVVQIFGKFKIKSKSGCLFLLLSLITLPYCQQVTHYIFATTHPNRQTDVQINCCRNIPMPFVWLILNTHFYIYTHTDKSVCVCVSEDRDR